MQSFISGMIEAFISGVIEGGIMVIGGFGLLGILVVVSVIGIHFSINVLLFFCLAYHKWESRRGKNGR